VIVFRGQVTMYSSARGLDQCQYQGQPLAWKDPVYSIVKVYNNGTIKQSRKILIYFNKKY
jgi:hypothetical protein